MTDPTVERTERVVLVTGTNSGIGLETALACASAGWRTVATVRDTSKAVELRERADAAGVTVELRVLDVTVAESVRACVDGVIADHGRLDALVNNAGAAHVGTVELDDMAEFRRCVEVNSSRWCS